MGNLIQVIRGDDVTLNLTCKDNDGNPIDITGYTVFFTVKENINDPDADAVISKQTTSHSNPTAGITTIDLSETDTDQCEAVYDYDFQLKDSSNKISSTIRGPFEVVRDVTIRTS